MSNWFDFFPLLVSQWHRVDIIMTLWHIVHFPNTDTVIRIILTCWISRYCCRKDKKSSETSFLSFPLQFHDTVHMFQNKICLVKIFYFLILLDSLCMVFLCPCPVCLNFTIAGCSESLLTLFGGSCSGFYGGFFHLKTLLKSIHTFL